MTSTVAYNLLRSSHFCYFSVDSHVAPRIFSVKFSVNVNGLTGGFMSRMLRQRIGLALVPLFGATFAFAQNAGSLRGTVTDTTGAVVPGATVMLTNEATKFSRQVVTDAQGGYFFASV